MKITPKSLRHASTEIAEAASGITRDLADAYGIGDPAVTENLSAHEELLTKESLRPSVKAEIPLLTKARKKLSLQVMYGSDGLKRMADNIDLVEDENFAALFEGARKALERSDWRP
ncbi:hypothetical protein [Nonomuraea cavernae]|nr:hypothetical protein [Nonomuraea cavernae]MCA2187282.1 hypothetical protein [Nonomuraea cavernae]